MLAASYHSDLVADIMPLLPGMDVLVTDYSSIVFDAALVPVPTVFLAPDLDDYLASRGMYGTYADVAGTDWAVDWPGALAQLDAVLLDPRERVERARALSAAVHAFDDGQAAARVHRAITARTAPARKAE